MYRNFNLLFRDKEINFLKESISFHFISFHLPNVWKINTTCWKCHYTPFLTSSRIEVLIFFNLSINISLAELYSILLISQFSHRKHQIILAITSVPGSAESYHCVRIILKASEQLVVLLLIFHRCCMAATPVAILWTIKIFRISNDNILNAQLENLYILSLYYKINIVIPITRYNDFFGWQWIVSLEYKEE